MHARMSNPIIEACSHRLFVAVVLMTTLAPAWAQHEGHTEPAEPAQVTTPSRPGPEHSGHGDMSMQGGPPPPDARDPHAYAGGYTRHTGAYALPPSQGLHMGDEHAYSAVQVNQLEYLRGDDNESTGYDAQAWIGTSYDRLVIKAEGEVASGEIEEARTEVLWGHALSAYWDAQLGLRHDSGEGPERSWLAVGLQGLAPYWFEVETTAYVGENGRTALRIEADYDLLITQRLILQPSIEFNLYGKEDEERGIGQGLAEGDIGLRLRYEFSRKFAPYVGIEWAKKFGDTADLARANGEESSDTRWVAGLRFWF